MASRAPLDRLPSKHVPGPAERGRNMDAVVGFVLAVLVLAVFGAPAWAIKCGAFGGLGFFFYVCIIVIRWLLGQLQARAL
jgi:hypothetical protein